MDKLFLNNFDIFACFREKAGYNSCKRKKEDDILLLYKSLEFKNGAGQKIKVVEIPVLEKDNQFYSMVQVRLQLFVFSINNKPQDKSIFSFREYLKRKMRWDDFKELYSAQDIKNNA